MEIEDKVLKESIPPHLFLNCIENAFKHGLASPNKKESIILSANLKNEIINISIKNIIQKKSTFHSTGFGQVDAKKRLEILYKNKAQMITSESGDYYSTSFKLPRVNR